MLSRDQILKLVSVKYVTFLEIFFWRTKFLPKDLFFLRFLKFWKNKASRLILWISAITTMLIILHFREFSHFYPILDYYKIRTGTNFTNPNGKSLDLHLVMWFIRKELFPDLTDFTEAIFKLPKISKHFSAMQCNSDPRLAITGRTFFIGAILSIILTGYPVRTGEY